MPGLQRIVASAGVASLVGLGTWGQGCPPWTLESDLDSTHLGYSVATAGDVNGDGYGDVIVGAPDFSNGQPSEGRAYAYPGSSTGLSTTPAWAVESDQTSAAFGWSVATAGDVDGDGYSDVIVGAWLFENGQTGEGRASVYPGSVAGLATSPAWSVESDQAYTYSGWSVATAGDVNGDGYSDVIVGGVSFDNVEADEGRACVYLGSATGLSTSPAWTAESDQDYATLGISVATAGDVNGDQFSDVIIGAHLFDSGQTDEGRAYVYLGSATGLSTSPAWTAESDQAYAHFGVSVASAGDVNGDGYSDVVVGAPLFSNGQTDEGRAFAYLGSATGLSPSPTWMAESDQANAELGTSVASAGDVNGDGYGDVIVGAPRFSHDHADEGRALVYLGSPSGLSTSPLWTSESDQQSALLGNSVATAGDVNGDGFSDVIAGAHAYDNGQTDEGRAYLQLSSSGFVSSAVFSGDGINADTIAPVNAVLGSSWSAPLTIGHPHGTGGPLSLRVRTTPVNGPNFTSPMGGRPTEILVSGAFLATASGSHDGTTGDIAPLLIPSSSSLVGISWAAQYTVVGGGFADLSQAAFGVIGSCP